jgi:hypothetical protein
MHLILLTLIMIRRYFYSLAVAVKLEISKEVPCNLDIFELFQEVYNIPVQQWHVWVTNRFYQYRKTMTQNLYLVPRKKNLSTLSNTSNNNNNKNSKNNKNNKSNNNNNNNNNKGNQKRYQSQSQVVSSSKF